MEKFELIIIGGGAGGFAAAITANDKQAKTAMINAGLPLGGTCVNVGCVPSKMLLRAGQIIHESKNHNIPGIELELKKFDFSKVIEDELNLVNDLRKEKYEGVLKHLEHVTLIEGKATFISENTINVNDKEYSADKFIISAGSTARVPDIENIREVGYATHIEALKFNELPKDLVIVGGGVLGLEFAQIYSRFGSKVTLLQRSERIFPMGEEELTTKLGEVLTKEGITIKTNATSKKARKEGNKKVLTYEINGKEEEIVVDEILLAVGKIPNTQDLGLEKIGVKVNEKQSIVVNEYLQTSKSNIFAVGDVNDRPIRVEPTAGREGTIATANILTGSKISIDYNTVPYVVFTDPEYASVGYTEEEQMAAMGVCACRTISLDKVPKALILKRTEGLIKMGILGVHILAPHASELISEAMILVKNKNTLDDVTTSLPMFPTLSESIKLVALSFTKDISKLSCCV